jgi:enoyl-CoA hydratase/carnithine racemase
MQTCRLGRLVALVATVIVALALGATLGAGGIQHLTRLIGRGRALEVMLGAEDFDADLAERYGWINRALPADELGAFVSALAQRIAGFPAAGVAATRARVDEIALPPAEDVQRDGGLFFEILGKPQAQARIREAFAHGFQTREAEKDLPRLLQVLGRPKKEVPHVQA